MTIAYYSLSLLTYLYPQILPLVISLQVGSVTLACYSILLIGLCHKKNIINFGVECCPPPPDLAPHIKTQFHLPSPRCLSSFPGSVSTFHIILSYLCVIYSLSLLIHVILSCLSVMSSCHTTMSLCLCHCVMSYCHTCRYNLNTNTIG